MLRITQNASAAGSKKYYSTADYYTEGQELAGEWRGSAAERLGLHGKVGRAQWEALCDNLDPSSGERLTARTRANRTVGYDFTFSVPKSYSLLYALTGDERLMAAFRAAVGDTMREMERELKTRVRSGGRDGNRVASGAIWGEFVHLTSRPVDGVPDPHLHSHCFVHNVTYDAVEKRFKAANFRDLKRDAPFFEAAFRANLAERVVALGLPVEKCRSDWQIAGVDRATLDKFSRRTKRIELAAREKGITSVTEKAALGAKTRERKATSLTAAELKEAWGSRLDANEARAIDGLARRIGTAPAARDERAAAREAVALAAEHCFERESVVPERTLLRESLHRAYGLAPRAAVEAEAARHQDLIRGEWDGQASVTTRGVLAEEMAVVRFAREGRGTRRPLGGHAPHTFARRWLNEGQRRAVRHVLECGDRVMIIRGAAGSGKTTMMSEAVDAIEQTGRCVVTVAPSASASRGTLRSEGFDDADTLARFLVDPAMHDRARGNVLWVDEAGLVGMSQMKRLFDLAERLDFRVILCGDVRQHGPVSRGAALRLLEAEAGLVPAQLAAIQRQSGSYRKAIAHLSEGRAAAGFRALDDLGWIKEVPDDQRYQALADEYIASAVAGQTTLVVSPTHAESHRTSEAIRTGLRRAGLLGHDERTLDVLVPLHLTTAERRDARNYLPTDVIRYHQNAPGIAKGTQVTVVDPGEVPLGHAERFTVYRRAQLNVAPGDRIRITANGRTADGLRPLHNGDLFTVKEFTEAGDLRLVGGRTVARDYLHLATGHVVTSHAAQSKTTDKVIVAMSSDISGGAISAQQAYVSSSRGRRALTIFTESKADLLMNVQRVAGGPTASEIVTGRDHRARALQNLRAEPVRDVSSPFQDREARERHQSIEREA